jgi:hypothetical protein
MRKYTVIVNYGGIKIETEYNTHKQAMRHYAGWYNHALDMCGQVENSIEIWHDGKCIMADIMT